jgi:hypothetical protein
MNKVVNVNLSGNAFLVEEDGYASLHGYLEGARLRLQGNPDIEEIMDNLEQSVADKMNRFLSARKTVVTSAEEAQLHDARLARIHGGQPLERLVERQQFLGAIVRKQQALLERDVPGAAAATLRLPSARVVNENASHHPGSDGEEVRPVAPVDAIEVDHAHVRLVRECGRLQGVFAPLAPHVGASETTQLVVHDRHQPVEGLAVSRLEAREEHRHITRSGLGTGSAHGDAF